MSEEEESEKLLTEPKTLDYNTFFKALLEEVDDDGIENVYTSLSAQFNDYIYSFLQDICNKSETDITIAQVLKFLPNEIKLLIKLTNIIEIDGKKGIYYEKYGVPQDVESSVNTINTGGQVKQNTPIVKTNTFIDNLIHNDLGITTMLQIHVILFFGMATKYFINTENKDELEITKYFKLADEVTNLETSLDMHTPIAKLEKLITYLHGLMYSRTHAMELGGGANKTRKTSKSSQLRKTIKKRRVKKIKRKSLRRRKPIKKRVNSKNRKVKRKIKNKTRKYKKPKKQKRSRKPKP